MKIYYKYPDDIIREALLLTTEEAEQKYKVPFQSYGVKELCVIYTQKFKSYNINKWGFYSWDRLEPEKQIPVEVYESELYKALNED
jgi:hypothetical protein